MPRYYCNTNTTVFVLSLSLDRFDTFPEFLFRASAFMSASVPSVQFLRGKSKPQPSLLQATFGTSREVASHRAQ